MRKPVNKIGFKFSWETETAESTQTEGITNIDNTDGMPPAFSELAQRVENIKKHMTTTTFARSRKDDKLNVISTYEFYLSLMNEYALKQN